MPEISIEMAANEIVKILCPCREYLLQRQQQLFDEDT